MSERSRSAVVALTELARRADPAPVPILEIAERRNIPLHVLEQLFSLLRRTGILRSQRGVKGGYTFLRAPREVTLLDVVECVDGPLRPNTEGGVGADMAVWHDAQLVLATALAGTTIADMVEREASDASTLMFHI